MSVCYFNKWFCNAISKLCRCEMQAQLNQSLSCELWVNNQAVSRESFQPAFYQVFITSLHYKIKSLHVKQSKNNKEICSIYDIHLKATMISKIYCDLNGNELEKDASIYAYIE